MYSLALTFELWAGTNPVARATPAHTAREIGGTLPELRAYRPELPESLTECVDACLHREPEARPLLAELHCRLEAALPSLNGECPVPAAPVAEPSDPPLAWMRASHLVALTAWGLAVTLVAAPLGRPGLALILGALTAPAILVASRLAWAPTGPRAFARRPVARPIYPAVAGLGGARRGVLAALGWCWLLMGAATLGLGSRLGLIHKAAGWSRSDVRGRQRAAVAAVGAGGAIRGDRVRGGRGRPRDSAASRPRRRGPARGPPVVGRTRGRARPGRRRRPQRSPTVDRRGGAGGRHPRVRRRPPRPAGRPAPIPRARPAIRGGPGVMP